MSFPGTLALVPARSFGLDLTPIPPRGLVPHAERMAALQERNAEIEFYAWCFIIGIAVLGFLFRR